MYKVDANRIIGRNITRTRQMAGITQETLSDRINDATGIYISQDAIGRYERGERSISMDTLVAISIGLDASIQQLIEGADPRNGEPKLMKKPVARLTAEEHEIFRYLATDWQGDRRALIIASAVYALLPPRRRADSIMGLMLNVSQALEAGEIKVSDLPSGMDYMEQALGNLYSKGE